MHQSFKQQAKTLKKKTFIDSFYQMVKQMDKFGIPVSLTYKADPHLKSFVGGFVTVLARLGVCAFFILQLI